MRIPTAIGASDLMKYLLCIRSIVSRNTLLCLISGIKVSSFSIQQKCFIINVRTLIKSQIEITKERSKMCYSFRFALFFVFRDKKKELFLMVRTLFA